jgi:hypothetical protein
MYHDTIFVPPTGSSVNVHLGEHVLDTTTASRSSRLLHVAVCDLIVGDGLALLPPVCARKATACWVLFPNIANAIHSEGDMLGPGIPLDVLLEEAWSATTASDPSWGDKDELGPPELRLEVDDLVIIEIPH